MEKYAKIDNYKIIVYNKLSKGVSLLFRFDKRRLNKICEKVLSYEKAYRELSHEELKNKTAEFKYRLSSGETLENMMPEAFAVVREASMRVLHMMPYRVQVIGGIVLHEGRIAEMKTGEGKTLTETMPAYLNSLCGQGVHIITVNEYLAERDWKTMSPLYDFLGVSSGVVLSSQTQEEKKNAYHCDITYLTNHEAGFDYLRDHLIKDSFQKMQRDLQYAIIDEVDSILIDEARTPLIITQEKNGTAPSYALSNEFVSSLSSEDVLLNEKDKFVQLSEYGVIKAEKYFHIENYSTAHDLIHYINQSLKAHFVMKKDKDYVLLNGEIVIVDEFTGRLGEGRRFSQGLHQAIEAKENVLIKNESGTLATITYQNFFRCYPKISGMTGTAKTEEKEFQEIYGLDVVCIPTNKPLIRKDHEDKFFLTADMKYQAIIKEIKTCFYRKQPVLVGTSSVEKSENISLLLQKELIPHTVLNAKNHKNEAEIIASAGQMGAVTIATNMAGRGTDILLGEGVRNLGGLKVIGTERHESRRIDNQLIGRSGRQGDPGESVFFISLEDDLFRLFVGGKLETLINRDKLKDSHELSHSFLSRQLVSAQKRVEGMHFDSRKHTIQYDNVLNEQRKVIYEQRNLVLFEQIDLLKLVVSYGLPEDKLNNIPKDILKHQLLQTIDEEWISHVDLMMELRQDAGNASYKGMDPVVEYTLISKKHFDEMTERIQIRIKEFITVFDEEYNFQMDQIIKGA